MAKKVTSGAPERVQEESRPVLANPDLFGVDLLDAAEIGLGMAASGYVNDTVVAKAVKTLTPTPGAHDMIGKLIDGGTTAVSGWVLGKVIDMVGFNHVGRNVEKGGVYLGVAKALSSVIPNFSISAQFPAFPLFPMTSNAPVSAADAAKQLSPAATELATNIPSGALAFNRSFGL